MAVVLLDKELVVVGKEIEVISLENAVTKVVGERLCVDESGSLDEVRSREEVDEVEAMVNSLRLVVVVVDG